MELVVFFDPPFWVALVVVHRAGAALVHRRVFGAEPGEAEVREFVRHELSALLRLAPAAVVAGSPPLEPPLTAAARRRWVRDALERSPLSTDILAALAAARAEAGEVARRDRRSRTVAEAGARRQSRVEAARNRHRGR